MAGAILNPEALQILIGNGTSDKIYDLSSKASSTLLSITNVLQASEVEKKVVSSINKKRVPSDVKQKIKGDSPTLDVQVGSKVFTTKCNSISIGGNNMATPLFMSGLKNPFGQMMGGRSCYASLSIVTNDPDTIIDVLSLFRSNSVYDTLNNMITQTRSLLKTKDPTIPNNVGFAQKVGAGETVFQGASLGQQLRMLSKSIKRDKLLQVIEEVFIGDTDLIYDQQEPMVIKHNLLNAFGYYTFVPTTVSLETMRDTKDSISINLNCQWVDTRFIMKEALKITNIAKNHNENHILSWYNTLNSSEVKKDNTSEKTGFEKKQEDLAKSMEYYKGIVTRQGTIFAVAPVLASYALYRYKRDILDDNTKYQQFKSNNNSLYENIAKNNGKPTEEALSSYITNTRILLDSTQNESYDQENTNTKFSDELKTGAGIAANIGVDIAANKILNNVVFKVLKQSLLKTATSSGLAAVINEATFSIVDAGFTAWNTTSTNYKSLNTIELDNGLTYTTFKAKSINSNTTNYFYYINLPFLMSTYYVDFLNEILVAYSNETVLEDRIRQWSGEALALIGNEKKPVNKNPDPELLKIINHTNPENANTKIFVYKEDAFLINTSIANEIYTDIKDKNKQNIYNDRKKSFNTSMEDFVSGFKKTYQGQPYASFQNSGANLIQDLYSNLISNLGINCFSIIQSIDDLGVNTVKNYFRNLNQDQINEAVAATFSMVTFNNLHELANLVVGIDGFISNYEDIRNKGIATNILNPAEIEGLNNIINLLTDTKDKLRINDLSDSSKNLLGKKARTLVAYGNNYSQEDTRVNDSLIFNSSIFIIKAILQNALLYSTVAKNNDLTIYDTFFTEPYKGKDMGWGQVFWKELKNKYNTWDKVLKAFGLVLIGALLTVLIGGVVALVVGIILSLVFVGIHFVLNSISENLLPEAVKQRMGDSEKKISQILNDVPKMYFGFYMINNITNTYDSDFFFLKNEHIYPPKTIGSFNGSINNVEDPDTHLTIPLPYYKDKKRVLHPGFWIWSEKSEDTDKIIRESQTSVAIAETAASQSNYSRDEIQDILTATGNALIEEAVTINSTAAVNILLKNLFKISILINLIKIGSVYGNQSNTLFKNYITPSSTTSIQEAEKILKQFLVQVYNHAKIMFNKLTPDVNLASSAFDMTISIKETIEGKLYTSGFPVASLIADLSINFDDLQQLPINSSFTKLDLIRFLKSYPDLKNKLELIVNNLTYRNGVPKTSNSSNNSEISYNTAKSEIDRYSNLALTAYRRAQDDYFVNQLTGLKLDGTDIVNIPEDFVVVTSTLIQSVGGAEESSSFSHIIGKTKNLKQKILGATEVKRKKTLTEIRSLSAFIQNTGAVYGEIGLNQYKQRIAEVINKSKLKKFTEKGSKTNPTFKVYFIQDNARDWLLMDDFYSYSGIESIETYDDATSPVQVCKLVVSNFTNALSSLMGDRLNRENPLMANTAFDAQVSAIFLKPGCKVKVFLGYGTRLREEDCVFTGEIVSMQGDQIREIICQSHGALLTEYISVEIPEVIEASLYDLPERRNIYSIHDLIITKMLQTHLVEKVPRFDGRLGDINTLSGPSAIDSDFTRIQVSTVKENLAQWGNEVLYNTIVKSLDINVPKELNAGIASLIKNSDKKFYNLSENIRIFNAPINDTRYINLLKKAQLTESLTKDIKSLNTQLFKPLETFGNKGWFSFLSETTGFETLSYKIGEIVSSIKEIFGGEKWANLQTITHNETYWDYMQEMAIQLPNHAVAVRSFEERNTLVITDTTRGYYRTGRRGSPDEKLSQYLINRLEPIKGNTIENTKLIIDNLFLPTEDSMALFILFYTYMTRILATLESDSQTRTYYETPNESQINAVVNLLELLMDEDGVDRINANKASTITSGGDEFKLMQMFNLLKPILDENDTTLYNQTDKTILSNAVENIFKLNFGNFQSSGFSSTVNNPFNEIKSLVSSRKSYTEIKNNYKSFTIAYDKVYVFIKEEINSLGLNKLGVSKNSVEARILAIALLFQNEQGAKEIGNKKENPKEVAGLLKYIIGNHIAAETSIDLVSPEEAETDLGASYEFFSKGEAIRLTCNQIMDWSLQCAYSRSSVHRKFSENHYKSTGRDIVSNEINLQKGFNAVEVSILKSPDNYKDLDNIDTAEKAEGNIIDKVRAQVNSNIQDKNLYKTFIKNGYHPDLIAGDEKVGAAMSVTVLTNLVRDYYGGQLVLVGDSDIKAWDIITLYDEMSDMFGTIQVKAVSQTYNKNIGWITTINPWLPALNQYGSSDGPDIPAMQYGMRFLQAGAMLATIGLGIWTFARKGRGMDILKRGNYYARKLGSKVSNISEKFATTKFLNKLRIPSAFNSVGGVLRKNNTVKLTEEIIQGYNTLKTSIRSLKTSIGEKVSLSLKDTAKIKGLKDTLKSFGGKEFTGEAEKKVVLESIGKIEKSIERISEKLAKNTTNDTSTIIQKQFEKMYEKIDKKVIAEIEQEITKLGDKGVTKNAILKIYKDKGIDADTLVTEITKEITKLEQTNLDAITAATKKYNDSIQSSINEIGTLKDDVITQETKTELISLLENNRTIDIGEIKIDTDAIKQSITDSFNKDFGSSLDNVVADLAGIPSRQKATYVVNRIKDYHKIGAENLSGFGAFGTLGLAGVGVAFGAPMVIKDTLNYFIFDPAQATMSGLISDYYSQNAVAISGLWCKGEPFVANLDGMTKASFTRGQTPTQIYTGRLSKGIQEFQEEFQDVLTESATSLQRSGESTIFQNSLLYSEVINVSERVNPNGNTVINETRQGVNP